VGKSTNPNGAVLGLQLSQSSQYAPSGEPLEKRDLAAAIHEEDDIWTALEALGAVPPSIRDLSPRELLEAVPPPTQMVRAVSPDEAIDTPEMELFDAPDDVALNVCRYFRC